MKKYILTIILVLLIVISIALNIFNKVKPISTEQTSTENTTKVEKSTININVYDAVHDKIEPKSVVIDNIKTCLLYTSPSPRDLSTSRMPSSA